MLSCLAQAACCTVPTLFFCADLIFSFAAIAARVRAGMAGEERDPAVIEQFAGNTGSIRPIPVQYCYLVGLILGATSASRCVSMCGARADRAEASSHDATGVNAIVIAFLIGISRRHLSAVKKGTRGLWRQSFALLGISTPNFWLVIML